MSSNTSPKNNRKSQRLHSLILASFLISAAMASGCRWDDSLYKKYPGPVTCTGYCVGVENLDKDGCLSLNGTWHPDDCINEVLPEVEGEVVKPAANEEECTAHSGNWKPGYCEISKTVCQEKVKLENSEIEYNKGYCMGAKELTQEECEKELTDGKPIGKWDNDHCVIDDLRCQDIHSSLENIQWLELEWHDLDYRILDIGEGEYIRCMEVKKEGDKRISCEEKSLVCGTMAQITSENPPPCDMTKTKYKQAVADMEESLPGSICQKDAAICVEVKALSEETKIGIGMCSSCPQDNVVCGNECVNVMNDPNNCGGCKNACGEHKFCNNGICVSTEVCSKPEIECYCTGNETSMSCTDTESEQAQRACIDPKSTNYCGATDCGHLGEQCSVGQSCDQGECKCPEGLVKSKDGSTCLNPYSPETCGITEEDVNNGEKPRVCDTEKELCDGKTCQCRQGYQSCDGGETCIDVLVNRDHCGVCGNSCGNNADCINGQCICQDGFSRCDTAGCDDKKACAESSYAQHCGAKGSANDPDENSDNWRGKVCAENNKCKLIDNTYQCVCPDDFLILDGVCINPLKSILHCGATTNYNGINCTVNGYKTQCAQGACSCPTGLEFAAIYEDNGAQKYVINPNKIKEVSSIDGVLYDCIDTKYNSNCCGSDCEKCDENKVCTDSECSTACREGFINCNGICLDISIYHVVRDNEVGETACKCGTNYCPINGDSNKGCLEKLGNNNNCGECGHVCPSSMKCDLNICKCEYERYDHCTFASNTYNNNTEMVEKCVLMSDISDPEKQLHLIREENCENPSEQGYQCQNELFGTNVCHKCEDGWANFDGDWSNGCETDLSNNVTNCGSIGNNCKDHVQNAAGVACVNNQCVFTVCNSSDYLNCNDKNYSEGTSYLISDDGCETNISTDPNSCGRCDRKCISGQCENSECCYIDNIDVYEDISQFKCCDGYKLIKYNHVWLFCDDDTRYRCIKNSDSKPTACWHEQ